MLTRGRACEKLFSTPLPAARGILSRSCVTPTPIVPLKRSASHSVNRSVGHATMGKTLAGVLYVVAMAAVIIGVDFVFFRNRFWERLAVNIGLVLVFIAFYFRFFRQP